MVTLTTCVLFQTISLDNGKKVCFLFLDCLVMDECIFVYFVSTLNWINARVYIFYILYLVHTEFFYFGNFDVLYFEFLFCWLFFSLVKLGIRWLQIMPNGSIFSWRMKNFGWCLFNTIYQISTKVLLISNYFSFLKFRFRTAINIKCSTYYIRWVTFMILTEL